MFRQTCILGIAAYQRFISPYKGFSCAHRVVHGGDSCSQAVKNLIRENGLWSGWAAIRRRFAECKTAATELRRRRSVALAAAPSSDTDSPSRRHGTNPCEVVQCDVIPPGGCGDFGKDGACDGGGCDIGGCDCSW